MKAKLYYEAHVTIDPVFDERRVHADTIAAAYGFKLAKLIMRKRSADQEVDSRDDTFMTGHATDLDNIKDRLTALVRHMQEQEFTVRRYKIEDTLLDSRSADELQLLAVAA